MSFTRCAHLLPCELSIDEHRSHVAVVVPAGGRLTPARPEARQFVKSSPEPRRAADRRAAMNTQTLILGLPGSLLAALALYDRIRRGRR